MKVHPLAWSVDRPLPVFMVAVLVIIAGFWSLTELPVNRRPEIQIPFAFVLGTYKGAAPEDIESEITIELEEKLHTLEGLRHMTSISREGLSTHILEFEDRVDMTESLRRVRDEADLAQAQFPTDADPALVKGLSFDDEPIIFYTLTGGTDLYRLRGIAEDLEPAMESVLGVADVEVFGGYERQVRVRADPAVLAHYGLTLADLAGLLRSHSESLPAGDLRSEGAQRLIRSSGEFESVESIRSIAVATERGGGVSLRDVATVEVGHERLTSEAWRNADPSVTLIVRRRPKADTLATVARLEAEVEALRGRLPPGVQVVASADQSEEIGAMLDQLGTSALIGMLLVVAVLLVVFGLRRALLVSSVLPISMLFVATGLLALGMEISNIALFAMILVLGLVVDGAIVVAEAIQSESENGARPNEAAKLGIARVGVPVISADLTTIAAFVPMLLMVGIMGQFMSVLPKVVVFALLGSVFVDHLLLPAAAGQFKDRPEAERARAAGTPWFQPQFIHARRAYLWALDRALERWRTVLAGAGLAFGMAATLFASGVIESIFLPGTDQGRFSLNYELPVGTPLEETGRVGLLLASEVEALPEFESYVLTTGDTGALNSNNRENGRLGPEYGRLSVDLVPRAERQRGVGEVAEALRQRVAKYAGVTVDLWLPEEGPPTGAALAIRVQGEDLDALTVAASAVRAELEKLEGTADVRVDYDRKPEIRVEVDRQRASSVFGITPDSVAIALLTAFRGIDVGRMWLAGERVDIHLEATEAYARTAANVEELPIRAADGAIVPLGEIAKVGLGFAPNAIFRHDTLRTITVRADEAAGYSSIALEAQARDALSALALPPGVSIRFGGESEERDRSYASLWSALWLGLLLIYTVIAIQFNSLLQPLIVLFSIPLALIGVSLGLLVTGTPFSFLVFIGIVSLTGIVVNSGIVLIDSVNKKRRAGMPVIEAVRDASAGRLRPIVLTAITTIAALLPLTLGVGEGGEFWTPLGVAIISGLLVSTLMTLFVVPVLYARLEGGRAGMAPDAVLMPVREGSRQTSIVAAALEPHTV